MKTENVVYWAAAAESRRFFNFTMMTLGENLSRFTWHSTFHIKLLFIWLDKHDYTTHTRKWNELTHSLCCHEDILFDEIFEDLWDQLSAQPQHRANFLLLTHYLWVHTQRAYHISLRCIICSSCRVVAHKEQSELIPSTRTTWQGEKKLRKRKEKKWGKGRRGERIKPANKVKGDLWNLSIQSSTTFEVTKKNF